MARFSDFWVKRAPVEPLGSVGVARQLVVTTTSANKRLTAGVTRISIFARNADMRFAIGNIAQTATATDGAVASHYIAAGERLDLAIPGTVTTPNIAAIALAGGGVLEITELA